MAILRDYATATAVTMEIFKYFLGGFIAYFKNTTLFLWTWEAKLRLTVFFKNNKRLLLEIYVRRYISPSPSLVAKTACEYIYQSNN